MEHSASSSLPLLDEASALLTTAQFGRSMQGYDTVSSTNTVAARWAADGAPEGSVVIAEYQEAGRGRLGRRWDAVAGQNVMASVILRPVLPLDRLGLITLAASLAVADAVARFVEPLVPSIKWPNDVLLEGRKCCGMLLETAWPGTHTARRPPVILGIGLNVNQAQFPPALEDRATSLLLATGRHVARAPLLAHLLHCLETRYRELHDAPGTLRTAYERRMHGLGRHTDLTLMADSTTPERIQGRILGITATGALRLETDTGILTFHAGEVTTQ